MFNRGSMVPAVDQFMECLISVQETLNDNLERSKETQKKYFDKGVQSAPKYNTGDWVWLFQQNIGSACPSGSFHFKRLGLFRVDISMGKYMYCLIFPSYLSQVHPIFHTSIL